MLDNILDVENLKGLARAKSRNYETKTVNPKLVEDAISEGWTVDRRNSSSVRLRKDKPHGVNLEDKVWTLLYRMGFPLLSAKGGGFLQIGSDPDGPKTQIDVVGVDQEIAIAVECKSAEVLKKRPQFQEELGKLSLIRSHFLQAINNQYPAKHKLQVVLVMFVSNIILSDDDRERARQANIMVFDDHDLSYYQSLVSQIGPAAKYQFLADMLPNKTVQGLSIRVPSVKTKIGAYNCYTFSITPEYLLKISYISHRSKGKASDVNTYQRMLNRSRLKKIREYIANDGIFPTNIVINLDKKRLNFERIHQETDKETQEASGVLGWLDISPAYKSAWIIDGQHRLFAYSGHERAVKSHLSVLAFEGLEASEQARLFIDINAKQKSVKQSLLQELYAELHWNADNPQVRVRAIVSKAITVLNSDPESPLYQRIQMADSSRSNIRCITLTSIFSAVSKTDFHIAKEKHGSVVDFGPLWAGNNDETLKRTVYILKRWLGVIRTKAADWWEKGAGDGGGLAMNDGIIACIKVLRSVFSHLESNGNKLVHLDNEDTFECVKKYAEELGIYLGNMSEPERKAFRELRGVQGQTTRRRWCEKALNNRFPSFDPPGLQRFLDEERAETNTKAKEIIDRIEITLQKVILEELKREFGDDENEWWMLGVPKSVRTKVSKIFEEDDGRRGGREYYFDFIDYRKIVLENWKMFETFLANGKGNKEKRTSWMVEINDIRNKVAHASSGASVSIEKLVELESYGEWLRKAVYSTDDFMEFEESALAVDEPVPS